LSQEQVKEEARIDSMGRATNADIDAPCPKGLGYLPFQRAGISKCNV